MVTFLAGRWDQSTSLLKGKIKLNNQVIQDIARELNYCVRSINNHIATLQSTGWIEKSEKSGYYFIKGFDIVRKEKDFHRVSAAEILKDEINDFKTFAAATIITSLINSQKRKYKEAPESAVHIKHAHTLQRTYKPKRTPLYFPISTEVLAKIINKQVSTAWLYRKLAHKAGYIDMKKSRPTATNTHVRYYHQFKKHANQIGKGVIIKNNQLFYQEAYLCKSNMRFKSRKKLF